MKLAELRKQKGLTQPQLARMLGVSKGAVAHWETGYRMPRLSIARKLASILDVPVDELEFPAEANTERKQSA